MTQLPKTLLSTFPNTHKSRDYTISFTQEITLNQQSYKFGLRYVPDKLLLCHQALARFLEQTMTHEAKTVEKLANDILENLVDEIIPRWIEINLRQHENNLGQDILITMEERQPNWENENLLRRLPPLF